MVSEMESCYVSEMEMTLYREKCGCCRKKNNIQQILRDLAKRLFSCMLDIVFLFFLQLKHIPNNYIFFYIVF